MEKPSLLPRAFTDHLERGRPASCHRNQTGAAENTYVGTRENASFLSSGRHQSPGQDPSLSVLHCCSSSRGLFFPGSPPNALPASQQSVLAPPIHLLPQSAQILSSHSTRSLVCRAGP